MLLRDVINKNLDRLASPQIHALGRRRPAFRVCGYAGLTLAFLLTAGLAHHRGLSFGVMAAIVLAAALTFLALAMATKIITGEERLVYYHHEIAVVVMAAALLWLLGQPILPYLDLTILGIGIFLACGRVGCLMVGCCHGRPARWGVCYRTEHAAIGFSPYLVGVRLFPIQAVESFWVLCVVIVGVTFVLRGDPTGTALVWYVVAYDLGRFWFEFLRGDPDRPYYRGFSQPQWLSLLLLFGLVWSELCGLLPVQAWHIVITGLMAFTMLAVALKRRLEKSDTYHLLHPRHIKEVAEAVASVSRLNTPGVAILRPASGSEPIRVACTSLGVQVSASQVNSKTSHIYHYTFSGRHRALTRAAARALAKLILQLKPASGSTELIKGDRDVFHLLIRSANR